MSRLLRFVALPRQYFFPPYDLHRLSQPKGGLGLVMITMLMVLIVMMVSVTMMMMTKIAAAS